jgi:hypothetical protein
MILTVIPDQQTDLTIAGVVATSLFAAGLNQGFPDPPKKIRQNGFLIEKLAPTEAAFKYRVPLPMVRL